MSTHFTQRLDHRIEAVNDALSLAYQFLLGLDLYEKAGAIDYRAVSVLTRLVDAARTHARVVADALPSAVGAVELPDDYDERTGTGLPLQAVLDDYRRRFGDAALAAALDGRPRPVDPTQERMPRSTRPDPTSVARRQKGRDR